MANYLYWISVLTFAVVLLIILGIDIRIKRNLDRQSYAFRLMLEWTIFFCLQDAIWGLCETHIINNDSIFFSSSTIFHISTVVTTFFALNYVIIFLEEEVKYAKLYLILDFIVIIFELILVLLNFFTPILFDIKDGEYITGTLRPLTFLNQYIVYVTISIATLVSLARQNKKDKLRFLTVFVFTIAPVLMGVFQLLYPDGPFYSLGYFLGCFVVYMFIVAKDRENSIKNHVLGSIAETYHSMHLIDLKSDTVEAFIEPKILTKIFAGEKSAKIMIKKSFGATVSDEYQDIIMEFIDLSTLSERMKGKKTISSEFIGRNYGWTRVSFVSVEKVGDELRKVMLITQIIDTEKKQQIDLLFKSYNDELTGLYNRRSYENDIKDMDVNSLADSFVFVSMDVNGLKKVNDTLGHSAGDELLMGAAECMIKCFSSYGKIYRTGGDEFCAMINANPGQLERIKTDFERIQEKWSGKMVDHLTVSCGYVSKGDEGTASIQDIYLLADKRMYEAKSNFYKFRGIDRRSVES